MRGREICIMASDIPKGIGNSLKDRHSYSSTLTTFSILFFVKALHDLQKRCEISVGVLTDGQISVEK